MIPPKLNSKRVIYVNIQKYWRKLKPLFESPEATKIWQRNFVDYYEQRKSNCVKSGHSKAREPWRLVLSSPSQFDSCDWRYHDQPPGPRPRFWDYACHSACHWVADLGMFVATRGFPQMDWCIITSEKHSTVWNGSIKYPMLFDINFSAIGVAPDEAWKLATDGGTVWPQKFFLRPNVYGRKFTRFFNKVTARGYI